MVEGSPVLEAIGQLLLAAGLGAVVGLERDIHGRAAGMRTHMLVCTGAALFVIMSRWVGAGDVPKADPGRIAAQVVTGIGFLGAGVIMREGFSVRGLTTAACLWMMAAVGMAAGFGHYAVAVAATGIALVSLVGFMFLERLYPKVTFITLQMTVPGRTDVPALIETVRKMPLRIQSCDYERTNDEVTLTFSVRLFHRPDEGSASADLAARLQNTGVEVRHLKLQHF